MKKNTIKMMVTFAFACAVAVASTGCDSLKKEPDAVVETEKPTEKQTEKQTETEKKKKKETEQETEKKKKKKKKKETEQETEKATEKQTETVAQTEARVLTAEQEKAEQTEFDTLRTMYAADDINVRDIPGTDGSVFESYYQGDSIVVVGETPNWYIVELGDYDVNGYVSKQFVSDAEVAPKTEEEREAAIMSEVESGEYAVEGENEDGSASSVGADSAVDAEYGVAAFAEPFVLASTAGANVRQAPSAESEIIDIIASDTSVNIIGYTDRWYKIEHDGVVGYVNRNLFPEE